MNVTVSHHSEQEDRRALLPAYLDNEFSRRGLTAFQAASLLIAESLERDEPREEVLGQLLTQGWSLEMAGWLYTQIRTKGPDLILQRVKGEVTAPPVIFSKPPDTFALMLFGWMLCLLASLLRAAAWGMAPNSPDPIFFQAMRLIGVAGIWMIARARRRPIILWCTILALYVDSTILAIVLTSLPKGPEEEEAHPLPWYRRLL